jgi:hypothetical protein
MNTDVILTQLATSALQGVIEGLRESAAIYGGDTTLTLDDVIELLQACVDNGLTPPDRHLHSVKA